MSVFFFFFLLAVGWLAGTFAFGWALCSFNAYKENKDITSLIVAILIVAVVIAADALAFSISTLSGVFLLIGLFIALFMVADPFEMTAKHAHEIGEKAAREAAIKEQMEEQRKRDQEEMKENARIYREAKKANEKKEG